jgi:hypothetical protein
MTKPAKFAQHGDAVWPAYRNRASDNDGRLGWRLFIAEQRPLLDTTSACLAVHRYSLLVLWNCGQRARLRKALEFRRVFGTMLITATDIPGTFTRICRMSYRWRPFALFDNAINVDEADVPRVESQPKRQAPHAQAAGWARGADRAAVQGLG